ncbi:MAG: DUF1674 domain-containing protein [Woeseia sp.]
MSDERAKTSASSAARSGAEASAGETGVRLWQRDAAEEAGANSTGNVTRARQTGPKEIGGRDGPEPTRYGDWELKGRCIDF